MTLLPCVNNKHEFAHVMQGSNFIEIFIFRLVFWEILNSELLYFIHLLEILTILDQRSAVSLTQYIVCYQHANLFTAEFVVSHCVFCELRGNLGFSVPSIIGLGVGLCKSQLRPLEILTRGRKTEQFHLLLGQYNYTSINTCYFFR